MIFEQTEEGKNLKPAWKNFDMLHCINNISLAAKDLKRSTLSNCWRKLLPFAASVDIEEESTLEQIMEIAQSFDGDGFNLINMNDLN